MRDAKVRFGVSEDFAERELSFIKQRTLDVSEGILHSREFLFKIKLDKNTQNIGDLQKSKKLIKSNTCVRQSKIQTLLNVKIMLEAEEQLSGGGGITEQII